MFFYPILVFMAAGVMGQSNKLANHQPPSRGFINTNSSNNSTSDYFALTSDGRLERIQLVFPVGTQVTQQVPATETAEFLLTPDGRLEQLQQQNVIQDKVVQYFKLTTEGKLQPIRAEEVPADAQEENGEYHILLPTGNLQKVTFMTSRKGNLSSAKVKYEEVEPLSGPLYKYASPLVRIV